MIMIHTDSEKYRPCKKTKRNKSRGYTKTNVRAKLEKRLNEIPGNKKANANVVGSSMDHLRSNTKSIPSKSDGADSVNEKKARVRYDGEMAEREEAAKAEIEAKQKRVTLPYSKGGYQYVPSSEARDAGKKV